MRMHSLCGVCGLVAVALPQITEAQQSTDLVRHERAQMSGALMTLESTSNTAISEAGKDALTQEYERNNAFFTRAVDFQDSRTRDFFVQTVLEQYLFEVRDARTSTAGTSRATLRPMDFARFPLAGFVDDLTFVYDSPASRLVVVSTPTDADITLDGAPKGRTNKVFVVSAGDHDVTISSELHKLNCRRKITALRGRTTEFKCPPAR